VKLDLSIKIGRCIIFELAARLGNIVARNVISEYFVSVTGNECTSQLSEPTQLGLYQAGYVTIEFDSEKRK